MAISGIINYHTYLLFVKILKCQKIFSTYLNSFLIIIQKSKYCHEIHQYNQFKGKVLALTSAHVYCVEFVYHVPWYSLFQVVNGYCLRWLFPYLFELPDHTVASKQPCLGLHCHMTVYPWSRRKFTVKCVGFGGICRIHETTLSFVAFPWQCNVSLVKEEGYFINV